MINEISPNLLSKNAEKNLFVWNFTLPLHSQSKKGSLAQLVQSICLTSRGSAVRIRQLPLSNKSHSVLSGFLFEWELPSHLFLYSLPMPLPLSKGGVLYPTMLQNKSLSVLSGFLFEWELPFLLFIGLIDCNITTKTARRNRRAVYSTNLSGHGIRY